MQKCHSWLTSYSEWNWSLMQKLTRDLKHENVIFKIMLLLLAQTNNWLGSFQVKSNLGVRRRECIIQMWTWLLRVPPKSSSGPTSGKIMPLSPIYVTIETGATQGSLSNILPFSLGNYIVISKQQFAWLWTWKLVENIEFSVKSKLVLSILISLLQWKNLKWGKFVHY